MSDAVSIVVGVGAVAPVMAQWRTAAENGYLRVRRYGLGFMGRCVALILARLWRIKSRFGGAYCMRRWRKKSVQEK